MSNPVKNPASFVGCRSGSGQIIAIRFRPEFPFRSPTDPRKYFIKRDGKQGDGELNRGIEGILYHLFDVGP